LKGRFSLEDLEDFAAKAVIHLGGSFIPAGDLVSLTVPPVLRAWPDVSSIYENTTFSREIATRKKGVELMGLGHPFMDALIAHFKGDSLIGEVLNIRLAGIPSSLSTRCRFTIEFENGSRKEVYRMFLIEGAIPPDDLELLKWANLATPGLAEPLQDIETRVETLIRNEEAQLRARHSNVLIIRSKCVGIQRVN